MLSFRTSSSVQSKYRSQTTTEPKLSSYVSAAIQPTKPKETTAPDGWTTVVKKSRPIKEKKRAAMVLPLRPTSKVAPFPTLPTKKVASIKTTTAAPIKTGWVAIAAKKPETVVEEQKSELSKMQEEMTRLREQINAAKAATAPTNVKKETIRLRNEFMDDGGMFMDSDGESMCWGDMVDEEFGLE